MGKDMLVIPAVDIKGGRCVRLYQGLRDKETVYFEDPVEVARLWESKGAKRLHVVDLDGAFEGVPVNLDVISRIAGELSIPVEVGGGIRREDTVEMLLEAGVSWVVVGTLMVEDFEAFSRICERFPGRVIAGIDGRHGRVVVRGWEREEPMDVVELARRVEELPVESIIFTEVSRDGTLEGVERELTRRLAESVELPVIASGGVATLDDIRAVRELEPVGVVGVIVGRALYEGRFTLEEALRVADAG